MRKLCVVVLLAANLVFVPHSGAQVADKPKKDAKAVSIAKDQIYSTSSEGGFKERLHALFLSTKKGEKRKPVHDYTCDLEAIGKQHGVSSVFLVRGDGVAGAMTSTMLIHSIGWSPDSPPDRDLYGKNITSKKTWLVVYLGTSYSGPPRWHFKSCVLSGNTIEFKYEPRESKDEPMANTDDSIQYFYWIPLPALARGTYELRLVDGRKNQPRLIRFVDFP